MIAYAGAAGYWIEGGVAAIGGGLCSTYLVRSSIGRIDTDQLNLGFMYLMFGLIIFAGRARTRAHALGWCVAGGLTANLFMWWYEPILIITTASHSPHLPAQRNVLTVVLGTSIRWRLVSLKSVQIWLLQRCTGRRQFHLSEYLEDYHRGAPVAFEISCQAQLDQSRWGLSALWPCSFLCQAPCDRHRLRTTGRSRPA